MHHNLQFGFVERVFLKEDNISSTIYIGILHCQKISDFELVALPEFIIETTINSIQKIHIPQNHSNQIFPYITKQKVIFTKIH
jgi:hypothetical protein